MLSSSKINTLLQTVLFDIKGQYMGAVMEKSLDLLSCLANFQVGIQETLMHSKTFEISLHLSLII